MCECVCACTIHLRFTRVAEIARMIIILLWPAVNVVGIMLVTGDSGVSNCMCSLEVYDSFSVIIQERCGDVVEGYPWLRSSAVRKLRRWFSLVT